MNKMDKCLFILGAGGFIGRALCYKFASCGWTVFAATRQPTEFYHSRIINAVAPFNEMEHFIEYIQHCGTVIHAASNTTPSSSAAQPQLDGNLRSTLALLEALQTLAGRRFIFLSSGGTVYDERTGLFSEETLLRPRSYHGAGKAAAEHFIQAWAIQNEGLACILRPSNVYGPGQYPRKGFGIIPAAFDALKTKNSLKIWGDGENVRDYLFIDDLVTLCFKVLTEPLASGVHTFNASSGIGTSLNELLARIEHVTGEKVTRTYEPVRSVDMLSIVPSNELARQNLGWSPAFSLDEGLEKTWKWFSETYK